MKKYIALLLILLSGLYTVKAQCNTVAMLNENFDGWKSIQPCWETESGLSMVYAKKDRITFYSLMTPHEDMYLISPKLKAGQYTLTLDISDNGGDTSLELVAVTGSSGKFSYKSLGKATEIKGGKRVQVFKMNKDARLGLKVVLNDIHQAVYVDNVTVQPKR